MGTSSWRRWLNQTFGLGRNRGRDPRRVVLRLENLEERVVPAAPVVFTVNTTADLHQQHAGTTDPTTDAQGHVSLRSAVEAANNEDTNSVGAVTIQFDPTLFQSGPATFVLSLQGTYGADNTAANGGGGTLVAGLTADDIVIGSGTNLATTILGPSDPSRIVIKPASPGSAAANSGNDIFESALDTNTSVNGGADLPLALTIQGVTMTGAGGGAVFTGADNGMPNGKSVTTLTNDVFAGDTSNYDQGGGAVTNQGGGDLIVSNCTFEDDSALGGSSLGGEGGAIYFGLNQFSGTPGGAGSLAVSNSSFIDDTAAATGTSIANGGAIFVSDVTGGGNHVAVSGDTFIGDQATGTTGVGGAIASVGTAGLSISDSLFNNDQAGSSNGSPSQGGAVAVLGATTPSSITDSSFSHDKAAGTGSSGGAVFTSGALTLSDSTLFDDTATVGGGVENGGGATVTANDDFWGADGGPNTAGSDATGGSVTVSRFLELEVSANPPSVLTGATANITADLLRENTGGPLAPNSLAGLPVGPISFGTPTRGAVASAQVLPSTAISTVSEDGNVVTATTFSAHGLTPGQLVQIQGVGVAGYNGTFVVLSAPDGATFTYEDAALTNGAPSAGGTVTALAQLPGVAGITSLVESSSGAGTTVTVATAAAHGFFNNQVVTISGVANSGFDGTFAITYINPTHFSYTALSSGLGSSTGGVAFLDGAANAVYTAATAGVDTVNVTYDNQTVPVHITVAPTVTSSTTDLPANAGTLTITGAGFDPTAANDTVTFNNGAAGTVTSATATTLTVTGLTGLVGGPLTAVVTVNAVGSGSPVQVATVTPVVTASTASLPADATTVTINGFGFDPTAANDSVTFDDGAAGAITSATKTSLTVTFSTEPTTAGPLDATVTVNGEGSGSPTQVATVTPVVTASTTPVIPATATTLTINGFGFDPNAANDTVTFNNGATGTVASATATTLSVTGLTGLVAGPLTAVVTVDAVGSGAPVQVATVTPVVTASATPVIPATATTLTIDGFGFDPTAANDTVTFNNGATGVVTSATATTLNVTGLTGLVGGPLTAVVTVNGQTSGSPAQVATVTPVVTMSAASLPANAATITIAGAGFDPTAANDAVSFDDGAAGTVTSATETSLTVTFTTGPATAGPLHAVVTVNGENSGAPIQVAAVTPVVTKSATPVIPATATTVTINGFGFDPTAANDSVTFNNGAGTVTSATATTLTVTGLTGLVGGQLTAVVTVDTVGSGAPVQVATVTPVVTSSTAPLPANAATITIAGAGFDPNAANDAVTFDDGAAGTVTSATNTSLTVTFSTEPTTAGPLDATVTVNGVGSGAPTQVATVTPVVTASTTPVIPATATTLTINGFGFDPNAANDAVTFNNGATGTVASATATTLSVTGLTGLVAGPLTAVVTVDAVSSGSPVQVATVTPVVTASATPVIPATATTLTINGFGFDPTAANDSVTFNNGATGTVTLATATTLSVTGLTGLVGGPLTAVVTVNGQTSGSPAQVATVTPVVTMSAASLPADAATITITGAGFDPNAANDAVTFDDGAAGTVTSATETSLTVTFSTEPTKGGPLNAVVTVNGENSGAQVQVATVTPVVTASTAPLPANAATITIAGTGFDTTAANDSVAFDDGAVGTVTSASNTSLTVTFSTGPVTAGPLHAVVTVGGASSNSTQVATVIPVVTSSTAPLPANATTLTINGFGFDPNAANDTVTLSGGATGTVASATATALTVTGLAGLTGGPLTAVVTVNGESSGAPVQAATVVPVVTTNTAALPANATTLTINGFGFDPNAANDTVTFSGGATGTVMSATATSLTISGLSGLTVGPLTAVVTVNSVSSGAPVQVATVVAAPFVYNDAGGNALVLRLKPGDNTTLQLLVNGVVQDARPLANVGQYTINDTGAPDTLVVDYSNGFFAPSGGVTFHGKANSVLTVNDQATTAGEIYTVTPTTAGRDGAPVTYDGLYRLLLEGAAGADTMKVFGTANATQIVTGAGNDTFLVAPNGGLLGSAINGPLSIDAGGGVNFLAVSEANASAGDTVAISANQIVGQGPQPLSPGGQPFDPQAVPFAISYGATGGSFSIVGLTTGSGADLVNVIGTSGPTSVSTGAGNDRLGVTALSGLLGAALHGSLYLDAGSGDNLLAVSEANAAVGDTVAISATQIVGQGPQSVTAGGQPFAPAAAPFGVNYTASGGTFAGGVFLSTGSAADLIRVAGKRADSLLSINAGAGNDLVQVFVTKASLYQNFYVDGGAGANALDVSDHSGGAFFETLPFGSNMSLELVGYPTTDVSDIVFSNFGTLDTSSVGP